MSEQRVAPAPPQHLFVVPTYALSQIENAQRTAHLAAEAGFTPVIVCNSESTAAALADHPAALSTGTNTGYGGAANLVASTATFQTMVLCNDDLRFTDRGMRQLHAAVTTIRDSEQATILGFLPRDRPRVTRLPGVLGVVALMSGLSAISRRSGEWLRSRSYTSGASDPSPAVTPRALTDSLGFPFVCVAFTGEAWHGLDGFDRRFPLYFEDMDVLARAHRDGAIRVCVALGDCSHRHSASARTQLTHVLPLLTVGARNYLQLHRRMPRSGAALLVTLGLLLRVCCWLPFRSDRGTELRAILSAIRAAWSPDPGPMPPWS